MTHSQTPTSIRFVSLGCPKNLVDSEVMLGLSRKEGFQVLNHAQSADVTVINTCSFVDDSKQESIDTILRATEAKKRGETKMVVVTGCLTQRYAEKLPDLLPEVDLFIGTGEYQNLPQLIRRNLAGHAAKTYVDVPQFIADDSTPREQTTPFYTRYIKISEGCSHRCHFCIIPNLRGGKVRSRSVESIINEIKSNVTLGVKELNFVAQDLNEFGRDRRDRTSLFELLHATKKLNGDFWIRLLYMYPLQFPDRLIEEIAENPHIAKYVDIPLQHISERMLKIMNRGSSSKYVYRLIDKLKTKIPKIAIRTTFIVGHPGETKADFLELKKFIQSSEFDHVGVFQYSREEDTVSAQLKNQVKKDVKEKRWHEIMATQKEIVSKKNKSYIGQTVKVLIEGATPDDPPIYTARTEGQAPEIDGSVILFTPDAEPGNFANVRIKDALDYDLIGEIIPEEKGSNQATFNC